MPVGLVLWLFFLHWLGDFYFQSHEMAVRKSKEWLVLQHHVWVVHVTLLIGLLPVVGPTFGLLWFTGANFVLHFGIDAVTSRLTARLWPYDLEPRPRFDGVRIRSGDYASFPYYARDTGTAHAFFTVLGFDQWLHAVCLLVTAAYFLVP